MRTGLRLEPVTQENVRAACMLKLRAGEEDLVAPVAWSLADAYTVPNVAYPESACVRLQQVTQTRARTMFVTGLGIARV